jgi:hypothetical protein
MKNYLINKLFFLLVLIICFATNSWAEIDVQIKTSAEEITVSDFVNLDVSFTDNSPNSAPFKLKFYTNDNFTIRQSGKFSKISIINGVTNSTLTYQYVFAPDPNLKAGKYKLPQGYLDFGHGNVQNLKEITINVVDIPSVQANSAPSANAGNNNSYVPTNSAPITFSHSVSTLTPYLGQQVYYQAQIKAQVPLVQAAISEADFPKMWFQSLGEAKESIVAEGNTTLRVISSETALYPLETGEIVIPARTTEVQIQSRAARGNSLLSMDDDMFSIFGGGILAPSFGKLAETKRLVAPALTLKAKPLPKPPFAQKYIPVGEVQLSTTLDKQEIAEGESLTLKITLTGDAHLGLFDLPDIQDNLDFKIYPEDPTLKTSLLSQKLIQEKSFNFAIVPKKSGELTIPTFKILTFNPETQKYKVLNSKSIKIKVKPSQGLSDSNVPVASAQNQQFEVTKVEVNPEEDVALQPALDGKQILSFGKAKLLSAPTWMWGLIGIIVIVLPGSFFILKTRRKRQLILANNPKLAKKLNAYNVAMQAINQLFKDENFDKLAPILLRYLGDKFMVVGESLTAKEAENLVLQNLNNSQLATKVRELINNLESQKYGQTDLIQSSHTSSSALRIGQGKKNVMTLIQEIERAFF